MDIDLSAITLTQLIGLTVVVTVLDVLGGIALSVVHGSFSLAYVATWLQSHVLPRVFPILALGVIGHGVPAFDIPAIPAAFALAIAGLTAYVLETIASLRDSFQDKAPQPFDTSPVPWQRPIEAAITSTITGYVGDGVAMPEHDTSNLPG